MFDYYSNANLNAKFTASSGLSWCIISILLLAICFWSSLQVPKPMTFLFSARAWPISERVPKAPEIAIETLNNRINLGLDIGAIDSLSEFSDQAKPRNFVYSIGLDFLRSCFKPNSKPFEDFRNVVMMNLSKNTYTKDKIYDFAN